jgi:polysaccharide export outer membrane protein
MEMPPVAVGHAGDAMLLDDSPFEDGTFQGEYLGLLRTAHVPEYFLRVEDALSFVFRLNGKPSFEAYRLNVGDALRVSSLTADTLNLETLVQPDGTIVLPQIGSVAAAGKTIDALRRELDQRYGEYIRDPSITVAPVAINRTVEELRSAIINRTSAFNGLNGQVFNSNGQLFNSKVTPNGTIQLPAIGSVPALGLTLDELRREVESRYAEIASGIEVTPVLQQRAPNYVYVLGEVARPGRFDLVGPTSVIQSISLAGGWNKGGNLNEVVILRRDKFWHLMATRVKVRPALYNYSDLAADDIWLRDSDIVIVPKLSIQVCDDWIELIFTKGIYGIIPFNGITISFFRDLTSLGLITR